MDVHTEIELSAKGIDFTVYAEGTITTGGSNGHGSDEPEWTEVENVALYHTDGRAIAKPTQDMIFANHQSYIDTVLIESV